MADAHPLQKAAWWKFLSSFGGEDLLASRESDCPDSLLLSSTCAYQLLFSFLLDQTGIPIGQ
ncbi:hypothetical protein E2562_018321 [Oryza meyeriana var. granulata]|uniref:Uncharacterized protein n=1 Tax=Oryza meyeriana var. granulata TaxID=110450 RepID=A0A6G1CRF8_9ORYZ|nr:hypothetical protein E2562_018321 [Oryza meyeriana var. granulata]